ncbi:MAG TPA: SirB2 family protein [Burkholderiaceae bacterium]
MSWFYPEMVVLHVVLGWVSFGLFLMRGLAWQFGAPWAREGGVMVLVFGANTLLAITGLSLMVLMGYSPRYDNWLLAKFIALVGYFVFGHLAFVKREFSILAYVGALLMMGYVIAVSYSRAPLLG